MGTCAGEAWTQPVGDRKGDFTPRTTIRDWLAGARLTPTTRRRRRTLCAGCARCGGETHDSALLPAGEYAYLLGLYLGDGCLSPVRRDVYKLRITLDSRYPEIIRECASAMAAVLPQNAVAVQPRIGCSEVYSYSKQWICLFPQHGPGRKHERKIALAEWQQRIVEAQPRRLLRGLIHSDGCRFTNPVRHPTRLYLYPRYQFTNRSADIRRIFCDACDRLGIEWRRMNARNISIAKRASVARLDEFVGPKA